MDTFLRIVRYLQLTKSKMLAIRRGGLNASLKIGKVDALISDPVKIVGGVGNFVWRTLLPKRKFNRHA